MRWPAFIIALAVTLTLDQAFLQVLAIGPVFPGCTATLVVFVALFAPRSTSMWAAFIAGLMIDLAQPAIMNGNEPYHVIGPSTLGYVLGTYLVLLIRPMIFRRNPLSLGMLCFPFLLAVGVIYIAMWSIRGFYPDTGVPWGQSAVTREFARILGQAVYSAILAIPLGWILLASWPAWKFDPMPARSGRR